MSNNEPNRRWCQFSLRTLILSVLVVNMVFGLIGTRMHRARKNQAYVNRKRVEAVEEVVAEIEEMGGEVDSLFIEMRSILWLEDLYDDPGGPDNTIRMLDVSFRNSELTETELERLIELLERLNWLTELRVLDLRQANSVRDFFACA